MQKQWFNIGVSVCLGELSAGWRFIYCKRGKKIRDSSWCPLNRGCEHNMGSANTDFTVCKMKYLLGNSDVIENPPFHKVIL